MLNSTQDEKLAQIQQGAKNLRNNSAKISLTKILSSDSFQNIISNCRDFRHRVFDPMTTLTLFIKQVLSTDKSCKNVLAGMLAEKTICGEALNSNNTGPYCKARQRLPKESVKALANEVGKMTEQQSRNQWRWRGRHVKIADGTMLSMPDTFANQVRFPQHGSQRAGAGFPIARLVAIISLDTGSIIDFAIGACRGKGTGEMSLLREIMDSLNPDDILLGDRYYPSFF